MENGKIQGIVVPLVTPLSSPDRVDEAAVERMVEHVIAGGVHAIFILGSTGEGPALTGEEQRRMIRISAKAVRGRVPLLAGISGASAASAVELGRFAASEGADAVVAAVPCYFPPDRAEIMAYYQLLVREIPLPLFVYNMPGPTHVSLDLDTVCRLAELPGISGYKDSSGDLESFRAAVKRLGARSGFSLLIGPEELTAAAVAMGGDGGVNGGANLWPELYVGVYEAVKSGAVEKAEQLQRKVLDAVRSYGSPATATGVVRRLKYELARRGFIQNILASPSLPMREEMQEKTGECYAADCR